MNSETIAAAERLAEVLKQENAALAALDLPRAAAMLNAKRDAATALSRAQELPTGEADTPVARQVASRLVALAEQNRALLERALAVQGRVIGVIARAIPRAEPAPRYGLRGNLAQASRPTAYALAARA